MLQARGEAHFMCSSLRVGDLILACLADSPAASFSISSSDFLISSTSSSGSTCVLDEELRQGVFKCSWLTLHQNEGSAWLHDPQIIMPAPAVIHAAVGTTVLCLSPP